MRSGSWVVGLGLNLTPGPSSGINSWATSCGLIGAEVAGGVCVSGQEGSGFPPRCTGGGHTPQLGPWGQGWPGPWPPGAMAEQLAGAEHCSLSLAARAFGGAWPPGVHGPRRPGQFAPGGLWEAGALRQVARCTPTPPRGPSSSSVPFERTALGCFAGLPACSLPCALICRDDQLPLPTLCCDAVSPCSTTASSSPHPAAAI